MYYEFRFLYIRVCALCTYLQQWKIHYQHVQAIISQRDSAVSQAQLNQRAVADPLGTVQGCLYGILANPAQSKNLWNCALKVSDGLEYAVKETERLTKEKLSKMTRRSQHQVSKTFFHIFVATISMATFQRGIHMNSGTVDSK